MVDLATVDRMAELARLELTDAERTLLAQQLGAILAYIDQLQSVDTAPRASGVRSSDLDDDVPPRSGAPVTPLRPDEPRPSLPRDVALANAPAVEDGQVRVPAFLGDA